MISFPMIFNTFLGIVLFLVAMLLLKGILLSIPAMLRYLPWRRCRCASGKLWWLCRNKHNWK